MTSDTGKNNKASTGANEKSQAAVQPMHSTARNLPRIYKVVVLGDGGVGKSGIEFN